MRSPLHAMTRSKKAKSSAKRCFHVEQLEERLLLASNPIGPLDLGGDARVDPDDFRVTAFATGLNFPVSMQQLSDGSLLVGTANPTSDEAGFFDATVELIRLVDDDGDGVADGPGQIVFTGLPGAVTSVREAGDLLFMANTNFSGEERRITLLRSGMAPGDPYTLIGHIEFARRPGSHHETKSLAVRETPGQPGSYDLVFGVGSIANDTATTDPVEVTGLITATINSDSIYLVTVDNTGATPALSGLTQIAAGVRNTAGLIFHPTTGDLYFGENGANEHEDHAEPVNADELNIIAAADIGGTIENFGFPFDYIEYRTDTRIGSGAVQPLVAFQPISSVDPIEESEGASEIAYAPAGFPEGLTNGIFVTFHGEGPTGTLNRENPVVYVDLDTMEYFHFVSVDSPGVTHLDGILATEDSLFLADIASEGGLRNSTGEGVIYQILSLPPAFDPDTLGIYDPVEGTFYLKSENTAGPADLDFGFGPNNVGWTPLAGDWDGDGNSSIGLFDPEKNIFFLQNTLQPGPADLAFRFGAKEGGWLPVIGDWDRDNDDSVGLYDPVAGRFFLTYGNGAGSADVVFRFGPKNNDWQPIAGDWNGDGFSTVGLYSPSSGIFYLRNSQTPGAADIMFRYGPAGANWTALSGDWNRDGIDTVGLYDPVAGRYFLTDTHTAGAADTVVRYGPKGKGWMPLMGNWGLNMAAESAATSSSESESILINPFATSGTKSFDSLSTSETSEQQVNTNDPLSTDAIATADSDSTQEGSSLTSLSDDSSTGDNSDTTGVVLDLALTELMDDLLI